MHVYVPLLWHAGVFGLEISLWFSSLMTQMCQWNIRIRILKWKWKMVSDTRSFSYCCHLVLSHLNESLHIQDHGLHIVTNSIWQNQLVKLDHSYDLINNAWEVNGTLHRNRTVCVCFSSSSVCALELSTGSQLCWTSSKLTSVYLSWGFFVVV